MTTMKHEAATDVATFSLLIKKLFQKQSPLEPSGSRSLRGSHCPSPSTLVYAWTWLYGLASKMDEYMDSLDATLDEVSERLITLGGAPYSSMTEFLEHSNIEERRGTFTKM